MAKVLRDSARSLRGSMSTSLPIFTTISSRLPPIYGWKNGYLCGTHPWPARQWTGSIENGWREVYDIDPGIVLAAAEKIDSARAFLKGVQA